MKKEELEKLLTEVHNGNISPDDALNRLKYLHSSDLGYARIDHHRELRTGYPEIIYCQGKDIDQVKGIFAHIYATGQDIMGTRATLEMYNAVKEEVPTAVWHEKAKIISHFPTPRKKALTTIAVVTAGTSDIPVAEEAAITAELLGNNVFRVYDAGVAGIHRLLDKLTEIRSCRVVIVIAGMEGALASVIGGLVDKPVIAVPTSVGYGANFMGVSALLAMLTSCASGVSVVNIDNGFGAGFNASIINNL
jgi:hypothetical protein